MESPYPPLGEIQQVTKRKLFLKAKTGQTTAIEAKYYKFNNIF